jgi:formyltetrahydrofolate synthetase
MHVTVIDCVPCLATTSGTPLHHDYTNENVELVTKGCCNLERHIQNALSYGVHVVSLRSPVD